MTTPRGGGQHLPEPGGQAGAVGHLIAKVRRGRAALDRVTKSAMHHEWVAGR